MCSCSKAPPWKERWVEKREIVVLNLYSCSLRELGLDLWYLACGFSVLINNRRCCFEMFFSYVVFQQATLLFTMHLCWDLSFKIIFYYWAVLALWSPWHLVGDPQLWRKLSLFCIIFVPLCFAFQNLIPWWLLVFSWLLRSASRGLKLNIHWWNLLKYLKEAKNKWNYVLKEIKVVLDVEQ